MKINEIMEASDLNALEDSCKIRLSKGIVRNTFRSM